MSSGPDSVDWMRIYACVLAGRPIPKKHRALVSDVLWMVSNGDDPTDYAGTRRGRGKRQRQKVDVLMGEHYLRLREEYEKAAAAVQEICELYGVAESTVLRAGKAAEAARLKRPPDWPDPSKRYLEEYARIRLARPRPTTEKKSRNRASRDTR